MKIIGSPEEYIGDRKRFLAGLLGSGGEERRFFLKKKKKPNVIFFLFMWKV